MGGAGVAPDVKAHPSDPVTDNVTAFKRPPAAAVQELRVVRTPKPRLPVALIFACLVVVYAGFRYFWR